MKTAVHCLINKPIYRYQITIIHLSNTTLRTNHSYPHIKNRPLHVTPKAKPTFNAFSNSLVSLHKTQSKTETQKMNSSCTSNAFQYNATLCACNPGRYLSPQSFTCDLLEEGEWMAGNSRVVGSMAGPAGALLGQVLGPLDSVDKVMRSETVVVKATLILVMFWMAFCVGVRFGRIDGGRTVWFRLRWWIGRLDLRFAAKHYLEDSHSVRKRKTELGGTFSVASWILFIGLLSALLYQVITRRSIELHRVIPINAPDLLKFSNDMEFNITAISSMSCSHLHGLDKLKIGSPASIYFKVVPLSNYVNYTCHNTSVGPTISLKCSKCRIPIQDHYISWKFTDLPKDPAYAVGFHFNLTSKAHGDDRHFSYVSGTLKPGNYEYNDSVKTFRGQDMNILKIHLFPQKFNYLNNLKLIQPLMHEFLPGSSFSKVDELKKSFENSKDGLLETTLYISYLSGYIVEIDRQKVAGIVSFLSQVGGLYTISLAIFLYIMLQCEVRFKNFRYEDRRMRDIRGQRRAQRQWDKLRKYVKYTWGRSNSNIRAPSSKRREGLSSDYFCGVGSLHRVKHPSRRRTIYHDKMTDVSTSMSFDSDAIYIEAVKTKLADSMTSFDGSLFSYSEEISDMKEEELKRETALN